MARAYPPCKCLNCNVDFFPDARNRGRQIYCSATDCRLVSKRVSQAKWSAKPANIDYFKGSENVDRVRKWRASHPEYWKRSARRNKTPSEISAVVPASQPVNHEPPSQQEILVALQDPSKGALQDPLKSYPPFVVGFIAVQMGCALQDVILHHLDSLTAKGQEILRHGAQVFPHPS